MMKIGIVLSSTPGYSETFFRSKIKGLQKKGIEVCLFCFKREDDFDLCPVIKGPRVRANLLEQTWSILREFTLLLPYWSTVSRYIKLERKEKTRWWDLFKRIYLNSHLLKAKTDWLHYGFGTMALGSETVAKAIGAKMAVSFRGFDIAVYPVKNPGCYLLLWKYVDKVHVISEDLLRLAKMNGLSENIPVVKITPAIDLKVFQSIGTREDPRCKVVFMTTGRLHWKKGLVHTLEALAILMKNGLDFSYKIIGEGEERERIAFAAYQLGLKERVRFLGKLPHNKIKEELEKADIYLQYSLQEGFCNAVLEAQAMGKLSIVSDAEGLAENVLHGQTGWVVPKYAPNLLAEQIRTVLLMDEKTKAAIAQNAMERIKREFTTKKQEREFLEFYGVEGLSEKY